MFSSPSYAKWIKVVEGVNGNTFYVDFERIRKHGGYVYFWNLNDYLKPDEYGMWSSETYNQVRCSRLLYKKLSVSHHKEPMGGGIGVTHTSKNPEWKNLTLYSRWELILKKVCSR